MSRALPKLIALDGNRGIPDGVVKMGSLVRIDENGRPLVTAVTVGVREPVVARSSLFRFLVPTVGLDVIPKAGTRIAQDGDHIWLTPYDDCVLVMPGTRNLKPGGTAVRLGRFEA